MVDLCFLIKKVSLYNNLISEQSEPITSTLVQSILWPASNECSAIAYMKIHCAPAIGLTGLM